MRYVALDTDVASLLIKDTLPAVLEARLVGTRLVLPFVTQAELYKWTEARNWAPRNIQKLESWMRPHPLLASTESVNKT